MAIRGTPLLLLAAVLVGAGFALGRFTATSEAITPDLPVENATREPAPPPRILPHRRSPPTERTPDPAPPPYAEVSGQGVGALVRVPHGTLRVFHENGRHVLKPEGHWINYASDGTKMNEGDYVNGVLHGEWTSWRDGQIAGQGTYLNGKEEGTFTTWFPSGQVNILADHRAGRWHGAFVSFHKNGNKKEETTFEGGMRHGEGMTWHENGRPHQQGTWQHGKRHGVWHEWNADGEKKE